MHFAPRNVHAAGAVCGKLRQRLRVRVPGIARKNAVADPCRTRICQMLKNDARDAVTADLNRTCGIVNWPFIFSEARIPGNKDRIAVTRTRILPRDKNTAEAVRYGGKLDGNNNRVGKRIPAADG